MCLTVVAFAAVARLRRDASDRAGARRDAGDADMARVTMTSAPAATTGLSAPLRASPSWDAAASVAVPPAGPRMFHGDARRRHRSGARGPRTVKVGWRVNVGGPVAAQVTTSPDETTLYASLLDGSVVALARDGGARRWSTPLGERVYSAPLVVDDGTLFVGSDAKRFHALRPDGTVQWKLEVEGEADSGAVLAADGTVIFAAGPFVHAVRRGGDLAWRFAARRKVFTAPALTPTGLVVFGAQDHHAYALTPDGTLAWATDLGADVDGSPAIDDDGAIYVGTDRGEVVRLDDHGRIVWRTSVEGFVRGGLSITRDGDVLAGTYGPVPRVVRLAPDGTIRGAFAVQGTGAREFGIHGAPLEDAAGTLYFGAQDDAAYAVDATGALLFRLETGADVDAPLTLLSDGSLVVPSEDGIITLLLP